MTHVLPWFFAAVIITVLLVLLSQLKRSGPKKEPTEDWSSDLILDRGQKRLYEEMQEYLCDELGSEDDWRAFKFLRSAPKGTLSAGPEVTALLAKEFQIDRGEAARRLTRILEAVRTVKKRAAAARTDGAGRGT